MKGQNQLQCSVICIRTSLFRLLFFFLGIVERAYENKTTEGGGAGEGGGGGGGIIEG